MRRGEAEGGFVSHCNEARLRVTLTLPSLSLSLRLSATAVGVAGIVGAGGTTADDSLVSSRQSCSWLKMGGSTTATATAHGTPASVVMLMLTLMAEEGRGRAMGGDERRLRRGGRGGVHELHSWHSVDELAVADVHWQNSHRGDGRGPACSGRGRERGRGEPPGRRDMEVR